MLDFTASEISDAQLNPRRGDVWAGTRWTRMVLQVSDHRVEYKAISESETTVITRFSFAAVAGLRHWTRTATLIERGTA